MCKSSTFLLLLLVWSRQWSVLSTCFASTAIFCFGLLAICVLRVCDSKFLLFADVWLDLPGWLLPRICGLLISGHVIPLLPTWWHVQLVFNFYVVQCGVGLGEIAQGVFAVPRRLAVVLSPSRRSHSNLSQWTNNHRAICFQISTLS